LDSLNDLVELRDSEFNLILSIIVILVSGKMNQLQHTYKDILPMFNLRYDIVNIGNFNNNLLEILDLMKHDIFRPFNIFYCSHLMEYNDCCCTEHIQYNDSFYVIHSREERVKLVSILNEIIENDIIEVSPEYYYEKMKMLKNY
jgi:hypothetical protein